MIFGQIKTIFFSKIHKTYRTSVKSSGIYICKFNLRQAKLRVGASLKAIFNSLKIAKNRHREIFSEIFFKKKVQDSGNTSTKKMDGDDLVDAAIGESRGRAVANQRTGPKHGAMMVSHGTKVIIR